MPEQRVGIATSKTLSIRRSTSIDAQELIAALQDAAHGFVSPRVSIRISKGDRPMDTDTVVLTITEGT
jgi:hypothetical protein